MILKLIFVVGSSKTQTALSTELRKNLPREYAFIPNSIPGKSINLGPLNYLPRNTSYLSMYNKGSRSVGPRKLQLPVLGSNFQRPSEGGQRRIRDNARDSPISKIDGPPLFEYRTASERYRPEALLYAVVQ